MPDLHVRRKNLPNDTTTPWRIRSMTASRRAAGRWTGSALVTSGWSTVKK